jgi:hypothetical protein
MEKIAPYGIYVTGAPMCHLRSEIWARSLEGAIRDTLSNWGWGQETPLSNTQIRDLAVLHGAQERAALRSLLIYEDLPRKTAGFCGKVVKTSDHPSIDDADSVVAGTKSLKKP